MSDGFETVFPTREKFGAGGVSRTRHAPPPSWAVSTSDGVMAVRLMMMPPRFWEKVAWWLSWVVRLAPILTCLVSLGAVLLLEGPGWRIMWLHLRILDMAYTLRLDLHQILMRVLFSWFWAAARATLMPSGEQMARLLAVPRATRIAMVSIAVLLLFFDCCAQTGPATSEYERSLTVYRAVVAPFLAVSWYQVIAARAYRIAGREGVECAFALVALMVPFFDVLIPLVIGVLWVELRFGAVPYYSPVPRRRRSCKSREDLLLVALSARMGLPLDGASSELMSAGLGDLLSGSVPDAARFRALALLGDRALHLAVAAAGVHASTPVGEVSVREQRTLSNAALGRYFRNKLMDLLPANANHGDKSLGTVVEALVGGVVASGKPSFSVVSAFYERELANA